LFLLILFYPGDALKQESVSVSTNDANESAGLAMEAGFDGVDIKGCHNDLIAELLGADERAARSVTWVCMAAAWVMKCLIKKNSWPVP